MRQIPPWTGAIAVFVAAFAAGCGPDEVLEVTPAADAAPPGGYPFDEPGDFDRSRCDENVGFDQLDLAGVYHADLVFEDFGGVPGAFRVEGVGADRSAVLFSHATDDVRVTADELFVRHVIDQDEPRIRALLLCGRAEGGAFTGRYASCRGEDCSFAAVEASIIEPLDEPVTSNMTVVSEYAGPAADGWPAGSLTINVRHRGDHVFLARGDDGLRIIDVSDPAAPVELGHSPVEFPYDEFYNDVKIVEDADGSPYAIVASDVRGAVVIDVSDPAAPVEVATFPAPPLAMASGPISVHTLFVEGDRAYLANTGRAGLDIFDVSDPTNPLPLGEFVHPDIGVSSAFVHDLFVDAGRVYLNYWSLGMVILDTLADPANPVVVGTFADYPRRTSHSVWVTRAGGRNVAIHGDEDFGAHVRVVDVDESSENFLEQLGRFETRRHVSVHNIMAVGTLAFVTYYQDGLRVLDVSNPVNPREIAHHHTWVGTEQGDGRFFEGAIGVDYNADVEHVYVADTHRGLFILTLDR